MFCCDAGSDELAVHSFVSRLTLRNLRAHCSTAALLRTISWQRIFKGLLEVTIVIAFSHMWLLTSYVLGRWCSETVNDDSARHVVLYCVERSTGESVAMLSLPQLLKLNYGVRQGRNQLFISGGGTISMNFHSMTSSCLFNHGKLFRKRSQICSFRNISENENLLVLIRPVTRGANPL